ncbi:rhomboid-related protein 3-like isoform X2 [Lineus longissimus]
MEDYTDNEGQNESVPLEVQANHVENHVIHVGEGNHSRDGDDVIGDRWKYLFEKFTIEESPGTVSLQNFRKILKDSAFRSEVDPHKLEVLEGRASSDSQDGGISYQEFVNILSNKRTRSFMIAVHCRDKEVWSENELRVEPKRTLFTKMVHIIAIEVLPDKLDRQYYADRYTCCPPPVFLPLITLLEICCFIYYLVDLDKGLTSSGPVPADSIFIYRPDKRAEVWRFICYMFIHSGWVHLFFNMLVQLLVGIPLEMVHGSCRIGIVYLAGVLAGSLGTSVFDMDAFLVGASGGVYALLAAHVSNILLNYSEMELGIFKLAAVFIIASADVGFAIYDRYANEIAEPPVSYVAHLTGALAGLTIGLVVLKNFEQKLRDQIMWWISLGVFGACTIFAVLFNSFYY